jgi:energy-coupling factor transporter ATP-binding protein EcfA2
LLVPPGLLVLDEPWEGLDAVARTLIPDIVAEVTAAGGSVLVSDHRGEITALPGAIHWTVEENAVHAAAPPPMELPGEVIVEVAVRSRRRPRRWPSCVPPVTVCWATDSE